MQPISIPIPVRMQSEIDAITKRVEDALTEGSVRIDATPQEVSHLMASKRIMYLPATVGDEVGKVGTATPVGSKTGIHVFIKQA